jgi:hypothetical protein
LPLLVAMHWPAGGPVVACWVLPGRDQPQHSGARMAHRSGSASARRAAAGLRPDAPDTQCHLEITQPVVKSHDWPSVPASAEKRVVAGPGAAYSQYVSCRIMNSARSSAVIVAPRAASTSVSK